MVIIALCKYGFLTMLANANRNTNRFVIFRREKMLIPMTVVEQTRQRFKGLIINLSPVTDFKVNHNLCRIILKKEKRVIWVCREKKQN